MIGDDRRPPRWKAARIIQHAWSRLYCNLYGHFYRPWCYQRGNKVQYECECCGELTPWMHKQVEHTFNVTFCPTWGDRGSDSQGYKKMSKLHKPPRERTIGAPEEGWTRGTYLVRVALKKSNDIRNAVLHAPYIEDYSSIEWQDVWIPQLNRQYQVRELHYLELVKRCDELSEFL